mmetsp:Transcript_10151/g.17449  ORF Transcript_10151/g.17449 Transcript_10151/m.17449 type:complete len:204 (-) Transcript_10151:47-658(-)
MATMPSFSRLSTSGFPDEQKSSHSTFSERSATRASESCSASKRAFKQRRSCNSAICSTASRLSNVSPVCSCVRALRMMCDKAHWDVSAFADGPCIAQIVARHSLRFVGQAIERSCSSTRLQTFFLAIKRSRQVLSGSSCSMCSKPSSLNSFRYSAAQSVSERVAALNARLTSETRETCSELQSKSTLVRTSGGISSSIVLSLW